MRLFQRLATTIFILVFSLSLKHVAAEPIQYCKSGSTMSEEINFCMGALMYHNTSTSTHDMFLTMTVDRPASSAKGWTAIGAGSSMTGSLMFIIYGDPQKGDPVVSIRTASGHRQPELLTSNNLAQGMDIRIVRSSWLPTQPNGEDFTARVSLVCYSCPLWPGTDVSTQSTSQPWIWAWNANQEFESFAPDVHLTMHKHHAGNGGWGNFYLDMHRSISNEKYAPSLPPIRPNIAALGASDTPMTFKDSVMKLTVGPGSYFHGLILSIAFLILFPLGAMGIRSGSSKSYTYHWTVQICASIFLVIGAAFGIFKSNKINSAHQWIGITLISVIGLQGILGYWHHVRFVRLRCRTWVSHAHIWSGRLIMIGGWANIIAGLLLRGYTTHNGFFVLMVIFISLQGIGLGFGAYWVQAKRARTAKKPSWARDDDGTFVISTSEDERDEDVCGGGDGVEEKTPCLKENEQV
jgi:hypothetical protein